MDEELKDSLIRVLGLDEIFSATVKFRRFGLEADAHTNCEALSIFFDADEEKVNEARKKVAAIIEEFKLEEMLRRIAHVLTEINGDNSVAEINVLALKEELNNGGLNS